MSVLRPYTEKNDYGGYTWRIELKPGFGIYIKGTGEGNEYHVSMEEYKWVYWDKKFKFISTSSLRETIENAFEKGYEYIRDNDEYEWPRYKMENMKEDALNSLGEYKIYKEEIYPLE